MTKNNTVLKKFLDNILVNIQKNVNFDNYFLSTNDKKMTILMSVFKIIKNSIEHLNTGQNKSEITKLIVENLINLSNTTENYELSAVLKDITNNFDSINETKKQNEKVTTTFRTIIVK